MNQYLLAVCVIALSAPLFITSSAFAEFTCKTSKGDVTIHDTTTCHFETSGGCSAKCTPVSFTATCGGKCKASASGSCTETCNTKCKTECTKQPDTFVCKDYCSVDCKASCSGSCKGNNCSSQCTAGCDTKCQEKCTVQTGATDCDTKCNSSCDGSCTVEANIQCDVDCTTDLTGGCTTKCDKPQGGLFCDNQYIDVNDVSDCNFEFSVKGQVTGDVITKCSTAPGTPTPIGTPVGVAAIAGLGLVIARRRSRKSP